MTCFIYF